MPAPCEVHFLDVGQGASSVILFHNQAEQRNEAVVIDCGPTAKGVPLALLKDRKVYLQSLILTHHDADHIGGAKAMIRTFAREGRLGEIYLVFDNSVPARKLAAWLYGEWQRGQLPRLPQVLADGSRVSPTTSFFLKALAPNILEANLARNKNEGSGVLELACGRHHILFCGDSTQRLWERIQAQHGRLPCDGILIPHHGGRFTDGGDELPAVHWFFHHAVKARVVILSFSTSNAYGHPRSEVVEAARAAGAEILCTQLHPGFGDRDVRRAIGRGVVPPTCFARSGVDHATDKEGLRKHVACAGSITVTLGWRKPRWGNRGDPDPICGFRDLDHFRRARHTLEARSGCAVLCHQF
jgi:competence protein ComEC